MPSRALAITETTRVYRKIRWGLMELFSTDAGANLMPRFRRACLRGGTAEERRVQVAPSATRIPSSDQHTGLLPEVCVMMCTTLLGGEMLCASSVSRIAK